jgi:hypothetical protein
MSYTINGARASMMDTLIDGATASHPTVQGYTGISAFPSIDAIGEFKVLGSNYAAEYGGSAGSVFNMVFKSGTNSFHGSAYEFLRNSALDANDYFSNSRGVPLASFKRSQFGGTLGGPIVKDKTFFLRSYEDLRQRSFSERTATVPHRARARRRFLADIRRTQPARAHLGSLHHTGKPERLRLHSRSLLREASIPRRVPERFQIGSLQRSQHQWRLRTSSEFSSQANSPRQIQFALRLLW